MNVLALVVLGLGTLLRYFLPLCSVFYCLIPVISYCFPNDESMLCCDFSRSDVSGSDVLVVTAVVLGTLRSEVREVPLHFSV